jgi:DNA-binding CsgD family transcriptional regulator
MSGICLAIGATGAVLLQGDVRTSDIPRTPGVVELINHYFKNGWHTRDMRAERGVPLLLDGAQVVIDQDILSADEMRYNQFYGEVVQPFGFQWFAAVGFKAGPALWAMTFQRTPKEGQFERRDKAILAGLSQRLTEVATLSNTIARVAVASAVNALDNVSLAAVAVDRLGMVLGMNPAAEAILDKQIRIKNGRLALAEPQANENLILLFSRLGGRPELSAIKLDPIIIRQRGNSDFVMHALPVHPAARTPFLGARAILTFEMIKPKVGPQPEALATLFKLTPAEARLACIIAEGLNPEHAAEKLGVSRETVRNQLRAIFTKTATHRQSELVALISRL